MRKGNGGSWNSQVIQERVRRGGNFVEVNTMLVTGGAELRMDSA